MTSTKLILALLALGLSSKTSAGLLGDNFLRWLWQSSVIDGNYLYIAGGEVLLKNTTSKTPNNPGIANYDHGVHVIDLSQSWTTQNVVEVWTGTQDSNLKMRRQSMYVDPVAKSVNIYGGWPYIDDPSLIPYVSSWPASSGPNLMAHANFGLDSGVGFAFTRKAFGVTAVTDKSYFNLGGIGTSETDPQFSGLPFAYMFPESGMLEYNFADKTWTNHTTAFNRVNGEAQFVPMFGDKGVLAIIGGDKPTGIRYVDYSTALVDMTTVTIYDIANDKYYNQPTTGDKPVDRSTFCSVGVAGASNKTFDIYVYGGLPGTKTTATLTDMATVYILSIPSFTWTKTSAVSNWRYANHCRLIGQSQMLNVGGVQDNSTDPDSWPSGLGIFDLNKQVWTENYDPNAKAYSAPSSITGLYNSDGTPKAAVSFADPALKTIFSKSTTTTSTSPSSSGTSSANTSTSPAAQTTSAAPQPAAKTPVGAIAGGVIGGIAIAAVLGALAFYLVRRRRRGPDYKSPGGPPVEMPGSGPEYYASKGPASEMGSGNSAYLAEMSSPNSGISQMTHSQGASSGYGDGHTFYSPQKQQQNSAGGLVGPNGQVYQYQGGEGNGNYIPRKDLRSPGAVQAQQVHELG